MATNPLYYSTSSLQSPEYTSVLQEASINAYDAAIRMTKIQEKIKSLIEEFERNMRPKRKFENLVTLHEIL